jgi:hypothetical protein
MISLAVTSLIVVNFCTPLSPYYENNNQHYFSPCRNSELQMKEIAFSERKIMTGRNMTVGLEHHVFAMSSKNAAIKKVSYGFFIGSTRVNNITNQHD